MAVVKTVVAIASRVVKSFLTDVTVPLRSGILVYRDSAEINRKPKQMANKGERTASHRDSSKIKRADNQAACVAESEVCPEATRSPVMTGSDPLRSVEILRRVATVASQAGLTARKSMVTVTRSETRPTVCSAVLPAVS